MEMTERKIFQVEVSQSMNYAYVRNCRDMAEFLGLKLEVKYNTMTFAWPYSVYHYTFLVEGDKGTIEEFKKLADIDQPEKPVGPGPWILLGILAVLGLIFWLTNF